MPVCKERPATLPPLDAIGLKPVDRGPGFPATTSRNRAIRLIQEQEDGLTADQKIAMIIYFVEDNDLASTYVLLTDPEVRKGWILMTLMKRQT